MLILIKKEQYEEQIITPLYQTHEKSADFPWFQCYPSGLTMTVRPEIIKHKGTNKIDKLCSPNKVIK